VVLTACDSEADLASVGVSRAALERRLGLSTAVAVIVGEVIGAGIFLTPARMASQLGSPFWLLIVWLLMGLSAIAGALCFGALAAREPAAGGIYIYLRRAYGRRVAFLYGWLSLLVTDPGVTAILAAGLADYLAYLVPLSSWGKRGCAVAALLVLAGVNMGGARLGSGVLRALAALKLGLIGFLVVWGFGFGSGTSARLAFHLQRGPNASPLAPALVGALIAAFVSFGGWWDASKLAGEIREPAKSVPRALVLGVLIVTLVYIGLSAVFLYLVPPEQINAEAGFAALAGEALFGRAGGIIFALIVVVALLGSLAAVFMAFPRVYFAMARDRLFLPSVAQVHPNTGAPVRAVAIQAALSTILVLSGTFDQILNYFMAATLLFLILAACAVFVKRHEPIAGHVLHLPGYPFTPLAFVIPTALLVVALLAKDWQRSLLGLAVVAAGIPVSTWVARNHPGPQATSLPQSA